MLNNPYTASFENKLFSVLEQESAKCTKPFTETEDLSAWSIESSSGPSHRTVATASPVSSKRHPERIFRETQMKKISLKRTSQVQKITSQTFTKGTPSFAAYLNSIISKNSQLTKRNNLNSSMDKQRYLEITSIRLHTSQQHSRVKSTKPEKLNRQKMPWFFEETFLVKQKHPPEVSGSSIVFNHKGCRSGG